MDDLLSAALSESGLDLLDDEPSDFNPLEALVSEADSPAVSSQPPASVAPTTTIILPAGPASISKPPGNNTAVAKPGGPLGISQPGGTNTAYSRADESDSRSSGPSRPGNSLPGTSKLNTNLPKPLTIAVSSALPPRSASPSTISVSQRRVFANGVPVSLSSPQLNTLLAGKKTIIIKNLPPGITAQALSRGGKLPIKILQSAAAAGSGTAGAVSVAASPLTLRDSTVLSVTIGEDGKPVITRRASIGGIPSPSQPKGTNTQSIDSTRYNGSKGFSKGIQVTRKPSPIGTGKPIPRTGLSGVMTNNAVRSEGYVISPLATASEGHKTSMITGGMPPGLLSSYKNSQSRPPSFKNVPLRTNSLGSAQVGVTRGTLNPPGSPLATPQSPSTIRKLVDKLQTGYMAREANPPALGIHRSTSTGQLNSGGGSQTGKNSALLMYGPGPPKFMATPRPRHRHVVEEDYDEEAEEELGHTDTYSNYVPSKLKIGQPHPDAVVETSSLSSVEPPDVLYRVCIPERIMDMRCVSALQLEAVTYACQQHETFLKNGERAGFLIGDGAGVGKGRTVAAVIYENYLLGRKRALWFSVSNDLKFDAQRDLQDIGAGSIPVHSLNKFRYIKINSKENNYIRKGVIFATYSSLIGESQNKSRYRTRLKQILHWCGKGFDGVIVLDECHKAKNLVPSGSSKPTKTGITVLELQKQLPKARIIYCSATGASEPKNMAYMSRLGIWGPGTPFPDFQAFIQAVEKRGVGAMEMVAMDMKLRGMYMARQLSFQGVGFSIKEIPLSDKFKKMYNKSVKLWCTARDRFQKAANIMSGDPSFSKFMWAQFWSAHQRFFKYLCIAAKVPEAVRYTQEAVKMGKCVVIGLQSTGEARTLDALDEAGGELTDFVSTAKGVFSSLMDRHFPAPNRAKTAGLFGLNFHVKPSGQKADKGNGKRKRGKDPSKQNKKRRKNNHDDDEMSDSSNDSDFSDVTTERLSSAASSEDDDDDDDDIDDLDDDEDDDDESENDNDNPFGDSDSDDDPWLKKDAKKKKKNNVAKKKKKKKEKKQKGKKRDREEEQMQSMADSALRALGVAPKPSALNAPPENNHDSLSIPSFPSATSKSSLPGMDDYDRVSLMKQELMDMLEEMGSLLPPNTLDELIEELGGPENVAEMTGRKGRVVSNNDGNVQYESRSEEDTPLEVLNLTEKQRFMDGEKYIAIISEAASSGISLQADRRVANQKRRLHMTLEIPWSADRAVQQFGRTHRSNQVSAPEYMFLISELAGERRFASIVAKRLECLGALTHGDRRATESRDLSQFNIDNKYGRQALEAVMKSIIGLALPIVEPPREEFFNECKDALVGAGMVILSEHYNYATLDKDYNSLPKFLNRILGIEVDLQNELFAYFSDTLAEVISRAKKEGFWDMGILDIISEGQSVKKLETHSFIGSFSTGTATTQLHKVSTERGLKWGVAVDLWSQLSFPNEGFYLSLKHARDGRRLPVLVKYASSSAAARKGIMTIYRPNLGQQVKTESLAEIKTKYRKVIPDEAKEHWEKQYQGSAAMCSHKYWRGRCRNAEFGMTCDVGLRSRTFYILSGSVLSVWTKVERILLSQGQGKMQLIRVRTADNSKLVGLLVPKNCVATLKKDLAFGATCFSNTHTE